MVHLVSQDQHNLLSHLYHYVIAITDLVVLLEVLNDTACQWYNLGLQLGISCFTLDAIETDQRGVQICLREMLKAWLKGQGGECTKHTLRTALSIKIINCRIVDKTTVSAECIIIIELIDFHTVNK